MNIIKNIKYINKLKKQTNDMEFLNEIQNFNDKIKKYNMTDKIYEEKINKHYQTIKKMFLNKKSNDIRYLKTKKMAYEYHLYLLNNYYNELCKTKFLEKLSN
jgi:hypothetical protein